MGYDVQVSNPLKQIWRTPVTHDRGALGVAGIWKQKYAEFKDRAMSESVELRVQHVDIGVLSNSTPVRISFLVPERPFPSKGLLRMTSSFEKGEWGFIDEKSTAAQRFYRKILVKLAPLLQDNTIIVLPELAGGASLTKEISRLMAESGTSSCYVVGGSYYEKRADRVASIAPIIVSSGAVHEQFKIDPAPAETERGCDPHYDKPLLIVRDTGFGNFAVVVCSDGLTARINKARLAIRKEVDLLIVPARNTSSELPTQLRTLAADEGIFVAYCNGLLIGRNSVDSAVFTPLKKTPVMPRSKSGCRIDIQKIRSQLDKNNARSVQRTWGFKPRAPFPAPTRNSPIAFQQRPKVLAIGSHFDDVWVGCAATLMVLQERYQAEVVYADVCDEYPYPYFGKFALSEQVTQVHSCLELLCKQLGFRYEHDWNHEEWILRDREFHKNFAALAHRIDYLWSNYKDADFVFVPRRDDYHDDHALTAKEVFKKFRRSAILEYEIKDFRRGPFQPTMLIDVTGLSKQKLDWAGQEICGSAAVSFAEKKARILESVLSSILKRVSSDRASNKGNVSSTFSREHVLGRLAIRASECDLDLEYAEAFVTDIVIS